MKMRVICIHWIICSTGYGGQLVASLYHPLISLHACLTKGGGGLEERKDSTTALASAVETTVNLTASPVLTLSNIKRISSCVQFDFNNI